MAMLQTVYPGGVNGVRSEEWQEFEIAVGSGATETVIPESALPGVEFKEGEAAKKGVTYEVANGVIIPNLEEK
eukprot:9052796-Karenia_brevis.AAC.1